MCSAKTKYIRRHLLFSYLITREVTTGLMLILNLVLVQNGNPSLVKTKLQRVILEQKMTSIIGDLSPSASVKKLCFLVLSGWIIAALYVILLLGSCFVAYWFYRMFLLSWPWDTAALTHKIPSSADTLRENYHAYWDHEMNTLSFPKNNIDDSEFSLREYDIKFGMKQFIAWNGDM